MAGQLREIRNCEVKSQDIVHYTETYRRPCRSFPHNSTGTVPADPSVDTYQPPSSLLQYEKPTGQQRTDKDESRVTIGWPCGASCSRSRAKRARTSVSPRHSTHSQSHWPDFRGARVFCQANHKRPLSKTTRCPTYPGRLDRGPQHALQERIPGTCSATSIVSPTLRWSSSGSSGEKS